MQSPQPPLTLLDKLKALHITYCVESGNALSLTNHRMDQWMLWERNGWTSEDLKLVIRYIRKRYFQHDKPQIMRGLLHFKKLVEPDYRETGLDYSHFEEYLLDARADQRNQRPPLDAKSKALAATGRPPEPQKPAEAKQAGEVAKDLAGDYTKLREAAGL